MNKISNINKENIIGGATKARRVSTSQMLNINFAGASVNNVINSIINIISTNSYLNNDNHLGQSNPYSVRNNAIRFGSSLSHSAISNY